MNDGLKGWPQSITANPGLFGWPLGRSVSKSQTEAEAENTGAAFGTTVTCGGSNTKGNYTVLSTGTPIGADGFLLMLGTNGFGNRQFLIDVAFGATGSEVIVVENLQASMGAGGSNGQFVHIPLIVPAGTAISARAQSTTASSPIDFGILLLSSPALAANRFKRSTTYGADTSTSGGTQVDPGGSAGTKGTWSQITAATTDDIKCMIVCVGNRNNTVMSNASATVEIGIGPVPDVLVGEFFIQSSTVTDVWIPNWFTFPVSVPSGTRLAARSRCSTTDASDRLMDITIIGFN